MLLIAPLIAVAQYPACAGSVAPSADVALLCQQALNAQQLTYAAPAVPLTVAASPYSLPLTTAATGFYPSVSPYAVAPLVVSPFAFNRSYYGVSPFAFNAHSNFNSFNRFNAFAGSTYGTSAGSRVVINNFAASNRFQGSGQTSGGVVVNNFQSQPRAGNGGGGGILANLRNATAQGARTGGLAGAAERLTGLGNGSGQFVQGALTGVLATRANLFGIGNGGRGGR